MHSEIQILTLYLFTLNSKILATKLPHKKITKIILST
jgi:hypothetical protein